MTEEKFDYETEVERAIKKMESKNTQFPRKFSAIDFLVVFFLSFLCLGAILLGSRLGD
ncbi:hypothetical protein SAMN02745116_02107 [Pilibacter termitis]|uniref:Uncharacterized protein n=1 Tax=Pilibacter termitis TaxID=263852 RepID=A0A1T4QAM6_9ENTE|nr:hypothetical protein [Pilibacter termitis]SKA00278.1 hypothetical protein SAMN02745116_02107 [Pilibacter termitis]